MSNPIVAPCSSPSFVLRRVSGWTGWLLSAVIASMLSGATPAWAQGGSVLLYGPSLSWWMNPSVEQQKAEELGYTVTVVDAAQWAAMTTADFATYKAIVFGDQGCSMDRTLLAPAERNAAVWSAAVTGAAVVMGVDPVAHGERGALLVRNGIAYAASGSGTGLYVSLSCYYANVSPGTFVPLLDQFGTFRVNPQSWTYNCSSDGAIAAPAHPVVSGMMPYDFSIYGQMSPHECFSEYPPSFTVVVNEAVGGLPYILATDRAPRRFQALSAVVEPGLTTLRLTGTLTLGSGTNDVDPGAEGLVVTVGSFSATIPAGRLVPTADGEYTFSGYVRGTVWMDIVFEEKKPGTWRFDMRVRGLDPVAVQLTIGDDVGSTIAVDRTAR